MQKGANFATIVSTKVLIGLSIKFNEIFAKQHCTDMNLFFSIQLPHNKISSESKSEILCADRVKL